MVASQSTGREFESRCGQEFLFCNSLFRFLQFEEAHANEIKYNIHQANTPVLDKVSIEKNMAAVCSSISLFMLALSVLILGFNEYYAPKCRFSVREGHLT